MVTSRPRIALNCSSFMMPEPSSSTNVRSAVFAQAVVDGGDPRQRKIRELDALVIGRKQNDAREHVANLADHLGQSCVLYVCHGPPKFLVLDCRIAALDDPDEFIPIRHDTTRRNFRLPNRDDSVIRRCRLSLVCPKAEAFCASSSRTPPSLACA